MSIAAPCTDDDRRIAETLSQGFDAGWNNALEAAIAAQPATAEDPNEDNYQRGFFDGVMAYGRELLKLRDEETISRPRGNQ